MNLRVCKEEFDELVDDTQNDYIVNSHDTNVAIEDKRM